MFSRLSRLEGCDSFYRRYLDFEQVPVQPALLLVGGEQFAQVVPGLPTVWTIHATIVLFAKAAQDPNSPPGAILNPLIDAVEAVIAPPPGAEENTLDGTCERVRIDGTVEVYEGAGKENQLAVLIPLTILAPA